MSQIEEKSKKGKQNETNNLQDIDNGDSCLNTAGGFSKDNKLNSVLNEDEVEKSERNDGNLAKPVKKKRKHEVTENESKLKVKSEKVSFSSRVETDGDSCVNAAGDFPKDNKLKSLLNEDKNEDEDEVEKGKGNDDNLAKVKKKRKVTENESNSKVKVKKVSFSSHVETFPASDTQNEKSKTEEDNLVRGKRFTPEEDEIVKDAVLHYIKSHALGEEGLNMVLNCHAYPQIRNCWREIGMCIPYRPHTAIYYRAHTLFERGEKRKWTKEETEFLQECYEKHGNDWKMVAKELGKNRVHVKDKWRRIKLSNKRRGKWSQEEYQNLYDLVNLDLQMKVVSQEKRSKHGMLRDDIPWGAISDKLSTRTDSTCCLKWYNAACVEDVDWDSILEHRPGDVCRKRWDQMVLHIGYHGSKPFSEQVEILSERYCPDLTEIREAWDSKPSGQ
ncbi:putative transcription factor MYB-HB-like family [Helianthus annuus]|nr:putative transcription factor MYB-HB-like family [Helianthus annuus]